MKAIIKVAGSDLEDLCGHYYPRIPTPQYVPAIFVKDGDRAIGLALSRVPHKMGFLAPIHSLLQVGIIRDYPIVEISFSEIAHASEIMPLIRAASHKGEGAAVLDQFLTNGALKTFFGGVNAMMQTENFSI